HTHHTLHSHIFYLFFFSGYRDHRHLHSFPTRRSSDLSGSRTKPLALIGSVAAVMVLAALGGGFLLNNGSNSEAQSAQQAVEAARSEEHTSELQSRSDLVCRLLLEKKKQRL